MILDDAVNRKYAEMAEAFLIEKAALCEQAMQAYVAEWHAAPPVLSEAVRYSLFARGKRLRPALTLGAAEAVGVDSACAMPAACAIEMIHTYSLIHDDLPAMDDDDMRRGRPTLHKAYGEATAILAGDALLTMAFDVAAQSGSIEVVREIAAASGVHGMAGGQLMDLAAEGKTLSLDELREIHRCKTGALIRVSLRCGATLAGASPKQLEDLTQYGEHIGLAFQIADDILDVTGTEALIGKRIGADANKEKATYPAVVGLDEAKRLADEARDAALDALEGWGDSADALRALAHFIVSRNH